jgi:hypothetical protein
VIERALDHRDRLRSYVVDLGKAARCKRPADMADEWMLLIDGAMVAGHLARDPAPARSAKKAAERLLRHYLA